MWCTGIAFSIVDLFNRELIALAVGSRPIYELVEATINMAMKKRDLQSMKGILFHTDQGSVFTSLQHHNKSKELGFTPSMSRKANCWDNAVIESIFSHFKTEFDFHYPLNNYAQAKIDLLAFRNYFNDERSQKRLGYKTRPLKKSSIIRTGLGITQTTRFGALWMPPTISPSENHCRSYRSGYH